MCRLPRAPPDPARFRTGLPPQPHRFEGLVFGPAELPPDDLAVANPDGLPELLLQLYTAGSPRSDGARLNDERLAEVAHSQDLAVPVPEDTPEAFEVLPRPLMASVDPTLGFKEQRGELNIGVDHLDKGIPIPSAEGVIGPTSELFVLPRHRPPSIPAAGYRVKPRRTDLTWRSRHPSLAALPFVQSRPIAGLGVAVTRKEHRAS